MKLSTVYNGIGSEPLHARALTRSVGASGSRPGRISISGCTHGSAASVQATGLIEAASRLRDSLPVLADFIVRLLKTQRMVELRVAI